MIRSSRPAESVSGQTPTAPAGDPMAPELATALADFARATKAAARAVSLYPSTHPSIQASLGRVMNASGRLTAGREVTLIVHPDRVTIDGRSPARPDAAIAELAEFLHDRLIGSLQLESNADAVDWHGLLTLLAQSPEDLITAGGIAKAWALTGRSHFEIREIDYAEVLRERGGGQGAEWDQIIANCLQGESFDLDERTLAPLLAIVDDPEQLGAFFDRLQNEPGEARVGARAAALLRILNGLVRVLESRPAGEVDAMLQSVASATSRLTPDMMMALISQARSGDGQERSVASEVIRRIDEPTVASFVASSVMAQRGATARLAQAFEALVPDVQRREHVVDAARAEAAESAEDADSAFDELWQNASSMLVSYSDQQYVSDEYARELSDSRNRAIEIDRISDDPPERVQAWLSTVSSDAVVVLDRQLLLDLLRLETHLEQWRALSSVVVAEIERLTLLGRAPDARDLLSVIVQEIGDQGRETFRPAAESAVERLAAGPLVRHVRLHLRKIEEDDVAAFSGLCHTLGPIVIRPLAEALATEENNKAIRRLREVLLGFGAAGRHSVEQLKNSANPAVRRTAIALLRVFGGHEALPELASMLDDADPQVQREAIRAIVQIGTEAAYAVLQRALVGGESASRETIVQQLIALRDDKAVPLLCYVLNHTSPRGRLAEVHLAIIEALGTFTPHPDSTRTLTTVLYRGEWWAPIRTAGLRRAAAEALRRLGSPEALDILQKAAARGSRGVRAAARAHVLALGARLSASARPNVEAPTSVPAESQKPTAGTESS